MKFAFAFVICLSFTALALAEPPAGVDPNTPVAHWYKTLRDANNISCCAEADCRPVKAQFVNGHWRAWLPDDDKPIDVPDDRVQKRDDNPTGHSILCASPVMPRRIIYCFIPMIGIYRCGSKRLLRCDTMSFVIISSGAYGSVSSSRI